jgi:hypothetical protein
MQCSNENSIKSTYLDSKNCVYDLKYHNESLFLHYHLVFDTSTFELANIDTAKFTIYQSAYFAWHSNYISYRILNELKGFKDITITWKHSNKLDSTIFRMKKHLSELEKKFSDPQHLSFVSYMIDSIPVEDYFTMNKLLNELYEIYPDPRFTWNYAHLINQFEKNQCGNKNEDVSYEIFVFLNIGIDISTLSEKKKKELKKHNNYFIQKCLPDRELLNEEFDKLNIYYNGQ